MHVCKWECGMFAKLDFFNVYFYFHTFLFQIYNRSTLAMVSLWLMHVRTAEHFCPFRIFLLFFISSVHFVKFHAHEYVIISFNWVDGNSSCLKILGSTWHGAVNSTLIMSTLCINTCLGFALLLFYFLFVAIIPEIRTWVFVQIIWNSHYGSAHHEHYDDMYEFVGNGYYV